MSKFVLTAQLQLQAPTNVGQVVSQIQNQLNNVKVNVQVQGAQQATTQVQQLAKTTNQAASAATQLGKSFGLSIKRFAAFSIATRSVSLFTSSLSNAVKEAISFERELIKISQVTGKTLMELKGLTNEITKLSTSLGVSSTSLLSTSRILSQAGLTADETRIALDALAKSQLAPTFDDIGQTAEGVIAIFNQFKQGAGELEAQLGAINAVAGRFAVEAGDLISVVRRTGGVFKAAGGDLNELIALFTSVRATTRESAESIATGLRTIFTRIQRPKTIEFLRQYGVELLDLEGKFVGPYEATKRLSEALAGLEQGDVSFIKIAEELGGFRQIGKVIPLLQEFSVAQEALKVAQEGQGSLATDAAKAQLALAIRITKVKEEFLSLVRSITETTAFQVMANTILNVAEALIKLADALKPVLPLLMAFAGIKLATSFGAFAKGISTGLQTPRGFAKGGLVPGSGNYDTVPAMLTPGEFVMRKSSVAKLGAGNLAAMNENRFAAGGTVRSGRHTYGRTPPRPPVVQTMAPSIRGELQSGRSAALPGVGKTYSTKDVGNISLTGINVDIDNLSNEVLSQMSQLKSTQGEFGAAFLRPEGRGQILQGNIDTSLVKNAILNDPDFAIIEKLSKSLAKNTSGIGAKGSGLTGVISALEKEKAQLSQTIGGKDGSFVLHAGALKTEFANKIEDTIYQGILNTVKNGASQLGGALQIGNLQGGGGSIPASILKKTNIDQTVGNIFEAMLINAKGPYDPMDRDSNAAYDFPAGMGPSLTAKFGMMSKIAAKPTDAKATFTQDSIKTFIGKTQKYQTDKYIRDIDARLGDDYAKIKTKVMTALQNQAGNTQLGQAIGNESTKGVGLKVSSAIGKGGFKRFATGGAVGTDTVPALLTPGEFVITRSAAKNIGYGNLNRMNKVGRYAAGGVVTSNRHAYGAPAPGGGGVSRTSQVLLAAEKNIQTIATISPELANKIKAFSIALGNGNQGILNQSIVTLQLINQMKARGASEDEVLAATQRWGDKLEEQITLANKKKAAEEKTLAAEQKKATLLEKGFGKGGQMQQIMQSGDKDVRSLGASAMKGQVTANQLGSAVTSGQVSSSQAKFIAETNKAAIAANQAAAASKNAAAGDNMETASSKAAAQADASEAASSKTAAMGGMGAGMGMLMAAGAVQAMLPPLEESSGAFMKLTHGALGLAMTIGGVVMAFSSLFPSITAASVGNFLIGNAGTAASAAVGTFGTTMIGASYGIGSAGAGASGGLLATMASSSAASAALIKLAGSALLSSQALIGKLVGLAGPAILAAGAFFAFEAAGKAVIDSIYGYDQKIKKATEEGDVSGAGQAAEAQAETTRGLYTLGIAIGGVISIFFPFAGAVFAGIAAFKLLTQNSVEVQKAQAEAAAQKVKTDKALEQSAKDATQAMKDFEEGNISASDALAATKNAGAELEASRAKNQAADDAVNRQVQENPIAAWWNKTANEEAKTKRDAELKQQEEKFMEQNKPALRATAREVAATGGNFDDYLDQIERANPGLYAQIIKNGSDELKTEFENIAAEAERTRNAFNAMNLGMQGVAATAGALSLSLDNYLASQEMGYNSLGNTIRTLEASVTNAAQGISDSDFKAALAEGSDGLRQLGASEEQIKQFEGNMTAINAAQRNFAAAGEETKAALKADFERGAKGANDPKQRREVFADAVINNMGPGVDEESKKRIKAALENAELSEDDMKDIINGNFSALDGILTDLGEKTLEQVIGPLKELEKYQNVLIDMTKKRLDLEDKVVAAQQNVLKAQMEAAEIIAKYGGPEVTNADRRANLLAQSNVQAQAAGVSQMSTGSAAELNQRSQEIRAGLANVAAQKEAAARGDKQALAGEKGAQLAAQEKRLQELAKADYETTKNLIKLKEDELKLIEEKNRLEKQSIESLLTGDIDKFFEQQAAVGATASLALGNQSLMGAFGPDALGAAALDIKKQQEAGVQTLYGQKLAGPGGLTERGIASAAAARGVSNPMAMAQTLAGTTGEEEAAKAEIRSLASTLPNYAETELQTAQQDLEVANIQYEAAKLQLEAARKQVDANAGAARQPGGVGTQPGMPIPDTEALSRGGMIYANRGIFVPRGTDTVPAMLTPGEFVVRREAVRRGNNLQILQNMNRGQSRVSNDGGAVAMADGGVVYARNGRLIGRNRGGGNESFGISSEAINNLSASLTQFNTEFSANIDKLNNTTFNVKLDPTNININLTGTSFIESLRTGLKEELLGVISEKLGKASVGSDGKVKETSSTLGQPAAP